MPRDAVVDVPREVVVDVVVIADVGVAVGVLVDAADVDGFVSVVVVARGLEVVSTGRLVAAGAGFDTPWLDTDAGRTRM